MHVLADGRLSCGRVRELALGLAQEEGSSLGQGSPGSAAAEEAAAALAAAVLDPQPGADPSAASKVSSSSPAFHTTISKYPCE